MPGLVEALLSTNRKSYTEPKEIILKNVLGIVSSCRSAVQSVSVRSWRESFMLSEELEGDSCVPPGTSVYQEDEFIFS